MGKMTIAETSLTFYININIEQIKINGLVYREKVLQT